MTLIEAILLSYLLVAAVTVCAVKSLLTSVIIYASYGVVMSLVWLMLAAPDLAITEAAVGTGISGVLFFVVAKRIRAMEEEHQEDDRQRIVKIAEHLLRELKKNAPR